MSYLGESSWDDSSSDVVSLDIFPDFSTRLEFPPTCIAWLLPLSFAFSHLPDPHLALRPRKNLGNKKSNQEIVHSIIITARVQSQHRYNSNNNNDDNNGYVVKTAYEAVTDSRCALERVNDPLRRASLYYYIRNDNKRREEKSFCGKSR